MEDRGRNIGRDAEGSSFIDPMMRGVVPETTEEGPYPAVRHNSGPKNTPGVNNSDLHLDILPGEEVVQDV